MNNRVCLHPDIKWHGTPKVIRADGYMDIKVERIEGALLVTASMVPKKMSRKRLVKLMMAHGMMPRQAKSFAEMRTKDGWRHVETYAFVIDRMNEFIDMRNKRGKSANADGLPV